MNRKLQSFMIFIGIIWFSLFFYHGGQINTIYFIRPFTFAPLVMFIIAVCIITFRNIEVDHDYIQIYNYSGKSEVLE